MIYVTGDTHSDFTRFSNKKLKIQNILQNEGDYCIVVGDFGLGFNGKDKTFENQLEFLKTKKFTTLFVSGNHDNYDFFKEYSVSIWHGGKVRQLAKDKVILLERGQVFDIEGKTFFTFGGAESHDIQGGILKRTDSDFLRKKKQLNEEWIPYRIYREDWWPEEMPSDDEMEEGIRNLERVNNKVDYVISHCCSTSIQNKIIQIKGERYTQNSLTDYFEEIENKLTFKHWFFGHYHLECELDERHTLLYYSIKNIEIDLDHRENFIPVLGRPRYSVNEIIKFQWGPNDFKIGKVMVVDSFGSAEQNLEPSYNVYVEAENQIYKHLCESEILGKI